MNSERHMASCSFLGKYLSVVVDRPIGYVHEGAGFSVVYPINYGYIPGVYSGDVEELDAYILGIDVPVSTFSGKVVAVALRDNDNEDKLIVAPDTFCGTAEDITQAIHFQEQWFDTRIHTL